MSMHAVPTNRELARLIAAARRAGTREAAGVPLAAPFFLALAIFLHASSRAAFLLSPIVGVPAGRPVIEIKEESRAMRGVGLVVVASVGVVSGAASAQEAVQWRVEDGGNGHWYAVRSESPVLDWNMASELATTSGGYLATIADAEENAFLFALTNARAAWGGTTDQEGPWLGGFRSPASGYWSWVTGEPFAFAAWCLNQPSVSACSVPETVLNFKRDPLCSETLNWGDVPESGYCSPWLSGIRYYLIEWSADCNADGIVDYGQILAGELADANANNIPDCCEAVVPCNCPADLDSSGAVNGVDLAIILNTWGTSGGKYPQADIDGDGVVGGTDLALVLGAWGDCQ